MLSLFFLHSYALGSLHTYYPDEVLCFGYDVGPCLVQSDQNMSCVTRPTWFDRDLSPQIPAPNFLVEDLILCSDVLSDSHSWTSDMLCLVVCFGDKGLKFP